MFTKLQMELVFGNELARSFIGYVDDVTPGIIDDYPVEVSVRSLDSLYERWLESNLSASDIKDRFENCSLPKKTV